MAVFQGDVRHVGGVDVPVGHDVRCSFMYCNYTPLYTVMQAMCGCCNQTAIVPGLPCGRAGRNHDNITLYSCDRPSPYCSRARICPGTGVNRLTFTPGQKSLSRYAISGHFREPGQANPQSPHTPTNRIGRIQPIPKSTYCPGSHVERLTRKPGQRELSRYAKNTRFRKPGQ